MASCTPTGSSFFGFPHWYQYMKGTTDYWGHCNPAFSGPKDILPIGVAVIDILLWAAGFIAVISIIVAGVQFITATGNPEKITAARKRIINALIGLGIVIAAIGLVSFLGRSLT